MAVCVNIGFHRMLSYSHGTVYLELTKSNQVALIFLGVSLSHSEGGVEACVPSRAVCVTEETSSCLLARPDPSPLDLGIVLAVKTAALFSAGIIKCLLWGWRMGSAWAPMCWPLDFLPVCYLGLSLTRDMKTSHVRLRGIAFLCTAQILGGRRGITFFISPTDKICKIFSLI